MIPKIQKEFNVGDEFHALPSDELYLEMYRALTVEGADSFGAILAKLCEMSTVLEGRSEQWSVYVSRFAVQVQTLQDEIFGEAIEYRENAALLKGLDKESEKWNAQFFESLSKGQLTVLAEWQRLLADLANEQMKDYFEERTFVTMGKALEMILAIRQER